MRPLMASMARRVLLQVDQLQLQRDTPDEKRGGSAPRA
jgi:hypothetical protein